MLKKLKASKKAITREEERMKAVRETIGKGVVKATAFITLAAARANMVMCDAFSDAETGVGNLQTKLVSLGKKLFPLAIVICAVAMFFTRDQKKFDVEKRILHPQGSLRQDCRFPHLRPQRRRNRPEAAGAGCT